MPTNRERHATLLDRIETVQTALDHVVRTTPDEETLLRLHAALRHGDPTAANNATTSELLQGLLSDASTALAADAAAEPEANEAPDAAWDRLLRLAETEAARNPAGADLLLRIAIERRSRPRVKGAGGMAAGDSGIQVTMGGTPPPGSAIAAAHAAALRSPADVVRSRA